MATAAPQARAYRAPTRGRDRRAAAVSIAWGCGWTRISGPTQPGVDTRAPRGPLLGECDRRRLRAGFHPVQGLTSGRAAEVDVPGLDRPARPARRRLVR